MYLPTYIENTSREMKIAIFTVKKRIEILHGEGIAKLPLFLQSASLHCKKIQYTIISNNTPSFEESFIFGMKRF